MIAQQEVTCCWPSGPYQVPPLSSQKAWVGNSVSLQVEATLHGQLRRLGSGD